MMIMGVHVKKIIAFLGVYLGVPLFRINYIITVEGLQCGIIIQAFIEYIVSPKYSEFGVPQKTRTRSPYTPYSVC